jgi:hydroxymethylbilane synthase
VNRLTIATRASAQARTQAELAAKAIEAANPGVTVELLFVQTTGDVRGDVPLHQMGGQGVFVKEVQLAVLDGRADLAVHSAKDLPSAPTEGLVIAAVPARRDPRDALVGRRLDDLEIGATVATGSVRRRALLAAVRPDLHFVELRGNIPTRLEKVPTNGALVMAVAALEVLGLTGRIAEILDPSVMLPQVAQGALAIECRDGDAATRQLIAVVEDAMSRRRVDAERSFLAQIGGGCDVPVAGFAIDLGDGRLRLDGLLADDDGRRVVRRSATGTDPRALGQLVGAAVRAAFDASA